MSSPTKTKFQCPACKAIISASFDAVGQKVACPKCSQRLQIPAPPKNKTVLAFSLPTGAEPASTPDAATFTPIRSRWKMPAVVAGVGLAAVLGGFLLLRAVGALFRPAGVGQVEKTEVRPTPRTPEEEAVRRFVVDNSADPAAIEFVRWGPHKAISPEQTAMLAKSPLWQMLNIASDKPLAAVRVVYRAPNQHGAKGIFDNIFAVQGGKVLKFDENPRGDDWQSRIDAEQKMFIEAIQEATRPGSLQKQFGDPSELEKIMNGKGK